MSQLTLGTALKARVECDQLGAALRDVLPFAQGGLPIYSGVSITADEGRLTLEATNGDQRVITSVAAGVEEQGRVIVPAKVLDGFVRSVSGAAELQVDEDKLIVSSGASSLDLHVIPETDWPRFAEVDAPEIELTAHWAGIKRVMWAQGGAEDKTPSHHCIHFDDGAVVALSTMCLAAYEIPDLKASANLPAPFMSILAKSVGKSIFGRFSERMVSFRSGGTEWMSRTVTDSYPNWRAVLRPESPHTLVVARAELIASLARTALLPDESGFRRMTMARLEDELVLSATGPDVGTITDVIGCSGSFEGEPILLLIPRLRQLADHCVEDEITFQIVDSWKHLQVAEGPWSALLMPLRPATAPAQASAPPTSSKADPAPS